MTENFTSVSHPHDMTYQMRRQAQIDELLKLSPSQLDKRLNWQMNTPQDFRDDHGLSQKSLQEMLHAPYLPQGLQKGILDSTNGTTGNVLIRQDLNFRAVWV